MKKGLGLMIVAAVLLSACSDGVPHVEDPHRPVDADGNPIKGTEFIRKYCAGKPTHETCVKVQKAVSSDATKGGLPKGW